MNWTCIEDLGMHRVPDWVIDYRLLKPEDTCHRAHGVGYLWAVRRGEQWVGWVEIVWCKPSPFGAERFAGTHIVSSHR